MATLGPVLLVLAGIALLVLAIRRPSPTTPDGRPLDRPAGVTGRSRRQAGRFRLARAPLVRAVLEARRRRAMAAEVPEVLDILRATISAGVAPRRALQAAAESAPPSLRVILGEAVSACELGSGVGQALAEAGSTHRLTELMVAGEALDLSELTGAPPGRVLAGVAVAAADRLRGEQARLAATAQARLSARMVAGMAPAFLLVLILTAPSDAAFLIRGRAGWLTLAAAGGMEAMGILWARRIVRGAT